MLYTQTRKLYRDLASIIDTSGLITRSLISRVKAGNLLPGKEFDTYARIRSVFFLLKGNWQNFRSWLCNPVSIVRYFEFPFVLDAVDFSKANSCLDVSSPRLFDIYLLSKNKHIKLELINPDKKDLEDTNIHLNTLGLSERASLASHDATCLPYENNSFDVVTSISVIEHIPDDGDSLAVKEMWRVLKPGGKMVITVPCAKEGYEEWRDKDAYGLGLSQQNEKYFFQRFYDTSSLQSRIFNHVGLLPKEVKVFGEKRSGVFHDYEQRWMKFGLEETIHDPLHIVRDYKSYPSIESLVGMGVCGLVFEKEYH